MGLSAFDKAKNKARRRDASRGTGEPGEPLLDGAAGDATAEQTGLVLDGHAVDSAQLIEEFDPEAFVDGVGEGGDWDVAAENMELEEGQQVQGVFLGWGRPAKFERVVQGVVEVNEVKTWKIKNQKTGVTGSFLSSTQLDQKLEGREGHYVVVARGPAKDIGGGKRMAQYLVKSRKI